MLIHLKFTAAKFTAANMGYSTFFFIICISFLTFSCGSNSKKTAKKTSKDTVDQMGAKKDSIVSPTPPPPGISPGSIRLKGQIISVHPNKSKNGGVIDLKIIKILGVGSATPAIAKNDTITVKTSFLPDSLQEGEEIIGGLQHRQVLAKFKDASSQWVLVHVKKNNNQTQKQIR